MIKIAVASTILPETNYSFYLTEALQKSANADCAVLVYADKDKDNLKVQLKNIKLVWSKNFLFPFQIAWQARRDRLSLIHLQHEINMFGGPQTAFLFPLLLLLLKILNIKIVVTIHAVVKQEEIDNRFLETFAFPHNRVFIFPVKLFFFLLYFLSVKIANKVIVHTEGLKQILTGEYFVNSDKIAVIPHGVPEYISNQGNIILNNPWVEKVKNKKIILCFGYLIKRKGLEDLIDACKNIFPKYPNYVLVLAGGSFQKDYENEIKMRAADQPAIIFTSFIVEEELKWLFENCEFVVLPATYSISASGPLAQAISFRKPVIAAGLGVFQEEIRDGVDGLLYEPFSVNSLSGVLEKLLINKALKEKLIKNMEKKYRARLWSNVARKTWNLYEIIIHE